MVGAGGLWGGGGGGGGGGVAGGKEGCGVEGVGEPVFGHCGDDGFSDVDVGVGGGVELAAGGGVKEGDDGGGEKSVGGDYEEDVAAEVFVEDVAVAQSLANRSDGILGWACCGRYDDFVWTGFELPCCLGFLVGFKRISLERSIFTRSNNH